MAATAPLTAIADANPSVGAVPFHEYANMFPLLEGQAQRELFDDVLAHGVLEPIVMFEGKILDGRNRYLAAVSAGCSYPVVEYDGPDALSFSISLNLRRRHLTESQRAMAAAKIANMPRHRVEVAQLSAFTSQTKASEILNVSSASVRRAADVQRLGIAELGAQVEGGSVSVGAASEVARLPAPLQVEIVEAGPAVVREVAAELRAVPTGPELTREQQAAVRVAAAEGVVARARPKPGLSHSNPSYCADPNFKAMSAVAGAAASIVQRIDAQGPAFIVRGFLDPDMRARNVAGFTAARDALNRLLEACNAH